MPHVVKLLLHKTQLFVLRMLMKVLSVPQPLLMVGPGSALSLCRAMADLGVRRVLIVTDAMLVKIGLVTPLREALEAAGVECVVYDGIEPDPTHAQIEAGLAMVRAHRSEAILAVGGGSPMDAAKVIAACATNNVAISKLVGNFKVRKAPLPIYAIPTTAGTGSEVTIAAVVTDPVAQRKSPVVDPKLVPAMAALDASLMAGLPPPVTAATGMDALTHAVESYISDFATDESRRLSAAAVRLIFANLPRVFDNGADIDARQAMAIASTYAGIAFSKASLGYVHAIAHNFGGLYHTPHGLANAIVLPHVLDYSKAEAASRLAELALLIGVGTQSEPVPTLAQRFIDKLRDMSRHIGIPEKLDALRAQDVSMIADRALAEAQGFYPVPRYMDKADCEGLIRKMLP